MKKCDCNTLNNQPCKSGAAFAVQHDDHIHDICGAHKKQHNKSLKPCKFTNCTNARKVNVPLATKQEVLPMTNTDGLAQVQELYLELFALFIMQKTARSLNAEKFS